MTRTRNILLLFVWILICTGSGIAQINNVGDLLQGGIDDAKLLVNEYLRPFGNGFGADLNNGWYNTAKTHKFLGIDVTITANVAIAPSSAESFDISKLGLKHMRALDPLNSITPTVVGDDHDGPQVEIYVDNVMGKEVVLDTLTMPQGIGYNYVPSPMIQGSVGLFINTDLIVRFFPEIEVKKDVGRLRMLGFGIKHDLKQWIPGAGLLPFDLSLMAGYTTFQAQADLNVEPVPNAVPTGASYDDQQIELEAKSMTLNILASKHFALFTLFGSVGFESSNVDIKMKGTYPVPIYDVTTDQIKIQDFIDPVHLSYDGTNDFRANVGFKLNLLLLDIYGSYTFSNYPVATLGVGLTIR